MTAPLTLPDIAAVLKEEADECEEAGEDTGGGRLKLSDVLRAAAAILERLGDDALADCGKPFQNLTATRVVAKYRELVCQAPTPPQDVCRWTVESTRSGGLAYVPECRKRQQEYKPIDGKCPWCKKPIVVAGRECCDGANTIALADLEAAVGAAPVEAPAPGSPGGCHWWRYDAGATEWYTTGCGRSMYLNPDIRHCDCGKKIVLMDASPPDPLPTAFEDGRHEAPRGTPVQMVDGQAVQTWSTSSAAPPAAPDEARLAEIRREHEARRAEGLTRYTDAKVHQIAYLLSRLDRERAAHTEARAAWRAIDRLTLESKHAIERDLEAARRERDANRMMWREELHMREAAEAEVAALKARIGELLAAWDRAESNRGCYSCTEQHDSRCESRHKVPKACSCGRVELEAAADAARALLAKEAPRG